MQRSANEVMQDVLFAASEVVRLGEKKLLQSDDDWSFLAEHLIALNQNWTRFLAEQRRDEREGKSAKDDPVQGAFDVLEEIGLDATSDVNAVIERVGSLFTLRDGQEALCLFNEDKPFQPADSLPRTSIKHGAGL